jgi:hypothetical protein
MRVGNVVKQTDSYWYGDLGEIDESIGDLFLIIKARRNQGIWDYEIANLDDFDDRSAWWHDDQLEFIRDGYDKEYQNFLDFADNCDDYDDDDD